MDRLRKIIIILVILVLILGVAIVSIKIYEKNRFSSKDGQGLSDEEAKLYIEKEFNKQQIVSNRNTYYSIENIVIKYVNAIKDYQTDFVYNQIDGEVKVTDEEKKEYFEIIKQIYKQGDNSISEKINKFNKFRYFWIEKMYEYKVNQDIIIYPIDGYIVNEDKSLTRIIIIIKVDNGNNTFSIIQEEYSENIEDLIKSIDDYSIEKNDNNTIAYLAISDSDWVIKCFNEYKQRITINPEYFYDKLDKEFREKRFGNVENFKNYITDNLSLIYGTKIDKYKIDKKSDYTEYIYIDQYNNYCIMQETNPLEYIMFLDSYTIEREEFIEKYNKGDDKAKVELNIGRFIEALNNKDYSYIYNHLDERFKSNNFETVDKLEAYMKSNFYDKNSINLGTYQEQNGIYIYDLIVNNAKNEMERKSFRIMVKLKENRDYIISFTIL